MQLQPANQHVPVDLRFQNIVVFDLETKRSIGGEVKWTSYEKMGISVGCLYDYQDGDWKVYLDDNIADLATRLNCADLVVGFNISGFDIPLLKGQGHKLRPDLPVYDLLYESRKALGWDPSKSYDTYPKGLKLDDHLLATFGRHFMKTGDGAAAPRLYQEQKMGDLVSYCLGDVRREKLLFEMAWRYGTYNTPQHGELKVADPRTLLGEKRAYVEPKV